LSIASPLFRQKRTYYPNAAWSVDDPQETFSVGGSLNGQGLRHISAGLDKAGLKLLLTSNPQLSKLFRQQNITNVIDHAKTFQASIDLWIDETNFYVHRAELKFDLDEDLSSPGNSATPPPVLVSSLATHFDSITNLSNFNQPVTITPPATAIPTNDPLSIFSPGS